MCRYSTVLHDVTVGRQQRHPAAVSAEHRARAPAAGLLDERHRAETQPRAPDALLERYALLLRLLLWGVQGCVLNDATC